MRVALLFLIALGSVVHAEGRVVAMIDDASAAALELTLAHAHVSVTVMRPPEGELALDRAAAAQRSVLAAAASAGVWIEGNDVCVVDAGGATVRRAPMPAGANARVFAAIAASLLDELTEAPEHVDVHLDVGPLPPLAPPTTVTTIADMPSPHSMQTLVEIGLTLSPATFGVEGELTFPLHPNFRIGVLGGVSHLFDGIRDDIAGTQMYDAAGELRYVGSGSMHWDVGFAGGVMTGTDMSLESDTGGFAALRFSYVRELPTTSLSFSVAPMALFGFRGQGNDTNLGVMGAVKVGLPI